MTYTSKRLYKSRNGRIFGVCQGIADWRDLPVEFVRLFVILIFVFTGFFPVGVIYFLAALILPLEPEGYQAEGRGRDPRRGGRGRRFHGRMYEAEGRAETQDNRQRMYENVRDSFNDLKDRVQNMEDHVFDKEKDWDDRFKKG